MAGYSKSYSRTTGDTILASDFNTEYQALDDAFDESSGHRHDGTATEGAYVPILSDSDNKNSIEVDTTNNEIDFNVEVSTVKTRQFYLDDGAIIPDTDNDIDLGTASLEFKNAWFDGTVNIDSLVADTADINAGTIDGVTLGGSSAGAITGTTIDATTDFTIGGTVITDNTITDDGTLVINATTAVSFSDKNITNVGNIALDSISADGATLSIDSNWDAAGTTCSNLGTVTTVDINGGTFAGALDGAWSSTNGLEDLTTAEVNQLENIGTSTISGTQWGYVGGLNQALTTTSNVAFGTITGSGKLTVNDAALIDGDADEVQLRVDAHSTQTSDIVEIYGSGGDKILQVQDGAIVRLWSSGIPSPRFAVVSDSADTVNGKPTFQWAKSVDIDSVTGADDWSMRYDPDQATDPLLFRFDATVVTTIDSTGMWTFDFAEAGTGALLINQTGTSGNSDFSGIDFTDADATNVDYTTGYIRKADDRMQIGFRNLAGSASQAMVITADDTGVLTNSVQAFNSASVRVDTSNSGEVYLSGGGVGNKHVVVKSDGKTSIGDAFTSPEARLHVVSSAVTTPAALDGDGDDLCVENNGACGITIRGGNTGSSSIFFADAASSNDGNIEYFHTTRTLSVNAAGSMKLAIDANSMQMATPLSFQSLTTAQRNALTPSDGWVIYNSDTNKFQGYANSTWADLN